MNTFEVAILRILAKRHKPLKLSTLVSGFPDDREDEVLAAISSLKFDGYITLSDYQPNGDVSIAEDRRREILRIVNLGAYPRKVAPVQTAPSEEKKSSVRMRLTQIRTIAVASLFIFALAAIIMPSLAAKTSTDTGLVAHHHNPDHRHVYGVSGALTNTDHPAFAMYVNWQNCTQKQQS